MSIQRTPRLTRISTLTLALWLAGCQTLPQAQDDGALQREAMAGTEKPVPAPLPLNTHNGAVDQNATQKPQLSEGSGQFVRTTGLAQPRKAATGDGAVTFNFENQPVQAVVKAILGDLLKQNYTIVPGVQGNVSFSTSEPVDSSQAIPILETLLSWTNNALVMRDGQYVVMPAKDAVGGNLVPSLNAVAPQGGLQARLFPLRFISATEMQKLIKPFARTDAVLLADPSRNVIVISGTTAELDNYQRTIHTFDVDWLRGMSVGVFSLQHANVSELGGQLDQMFGPKGDTPLAGMVRFLPIERTNAIVVISSQPQYLQEVGDWITKIDRGGGNEPELFVYDVRNLKASDLAQYLGQIYTNGGGAGGNAGKVGPGLTGSTLGTDNANGNASGMGSTAGSFGSSTPSVNGVGGGFGNAGGFGGTGTTGTTGTTGGFGTTGTGTSGGFGSTGGSAAGGMSSFGASNNPGGSNSAGQQYVSEDGSIRISSVDSNNQLIVRARPSQWKEIEQAIKRLDNVPLQVQIEMRILEVDLTGELQFGVQWYLQGLANSTPIPGGGGAVTPGYPGAHRQIALGNGGNQYNTADSLFYSFLSSNGKFQVAIQALETSSNSKTLSAPSMVVLNNQVAHIQVGDQIPINQTSIVTGLNTTGSTATSVSYIPTGVILDVQPRVNPGGLVYLNVQQQVSSIVPNSTNSQGNSTIQQRAVGTQIAVQSGQTVLLGGLIQQNESVTDNGIPGLNRIPWVGRLFGTTDHSRNRTELIVLITPRVITSSEEAKQVTDEYQRKFESLAPLRATGATAGGGAAAGPAAGAASTTAHP